MLPPSRPLADRDERPKDQPVNLDAAQAAVFSQIDGQRSVRQCLQAVGCRLDDPTHVDFGRRFFGSLWRMGYLLFRLPGSGERGV